MNENLKAFLETTKNDPELRERLTKMTAGELVVAAREMGFEITEEDLKPPVGEVSEAELGNVAGGRHGACIVGGMEIDPDGPSGSTLCLCFIYGIGDDCLCPVIGAGWD